MREVGLDNPQDPIQLNGQWLHQTSPCSSRQLNVLSLFVPFPCGFLGCSQRAEPGVAAQEACQRRSPRRSDYLAPINSSSVTWCLLSLELHLPEVEKEQGRAQARSPGPANTCRISMVPVSHSGGAPCSEGFRTWKLDVPMCYPLKC